MAAEDVQELVMEVYPSLGVNTALNPAQLPQGSQRRAFDACMRSINTIGKRDGSAPVINDAVPSAISHLTGYRTNQTTEELYAVSANTLYKLNVDDLDAVTMTNPFVTPNVYSVAFTDATSASVLFLTDGGSVKRYNGTNVANVTPAANDPNPAPPNGLTTINALGIKYCWVHSGHIFVTDGSDTVYYSKRYTFDYFPVVQFERWVRNNDIITGPGITFNNVCLIPMRRGWGFLTGELFDDGVTANGFSGNRFLNTVAGNISPRGMARITYPDGTETIAYLSDSGVHEIYTVTALSTGDRQYATKSITENKLDINEFGFTEAEKKAAVVWFDQDRSQMLISIKRDTTNYILCYDTRNSEWYVWRLPWAVGALEKFNGINYFGSATKLLHAFSTDLYSDWNEIGKTTGTPVDFDVYSGLLSFEFSGDSSYLHYYLVEAQQFPLKSSIDVAIIYGSGTRYDVEALRNTVFIWGVPGWDVAECANLDYTDLINNAKRLVFHKKAKYFQRRWRNNRDEPVIILREKLIGSVSGRL
ncbi:hypothetical protein [Paenibacillus sinopodophylli]|uniref:hypothetical protein n=1 Tax=Paenibacillus sinopodophylli TaxID=1837342 RepID=UPI00110C96BE|nr:hypothetical protein [Paenibacillus sinopodophylli]